MLVPLESDSSDVDGVGHHRVASSPRTIVAESAYASSLYNRTSLIRPPSESHWCGRIRGMVAREGFVYKQKALSVTQNVVV